MASLYKTLGVSRRADEQQVKAAYRMLAKRFHPDVNGGDEAGEQRFKEVGRAYETLADPTARAAYDRILAGRHAEVRRRYRRLAAIATATAVLTAGPVCIPVLWVQHLDAPQSHSARAAGQDAAFEGTHSSQIAGVPDPGRGTVGVSSQRVQASRWTIYQSVRFGFALRYPADVFAPDSGQGDGNVRTLVSRDGRAMLRIFAAENRAGTTLARYRRSLIAQRYAGAVFDHAPQRHSWFALSGIRGDKTFYERVTFSCDGRSMHGWQMIYPLTERRFYDRIAEKVYRNYKYGNSPRARCGRG